MNTASKGLQSSGCYGGPGRLVDGAFLTDTLANQTAALLSAFVNGSVFFFFLRSRKASPPSGLKGDVLKAVCAGACRLSPEPPRPSLHVEIKCGSRS